MMQIRRKKKKKKDEWVDSVYQFLAFLIVADLLNPAL